MSSIVGSAPEKAGAVGGSEPKEADMLSLRVCIGWGAGSIVTITLVNLINTLFLKYFVDVVGLTAGLVTVIIAATRVFDAITDPVMGAISDKTSTRWGRRRPYLLLGGALCAFVPIFIFSIPTDIGQTAMIVWITTGLLFYTIGATVFNVPYLAMPVEMTDHKHDRTRLMSFRIYGMAVGVLLGGAAAANIADYLGGDVSAFRTMAILIGMVILTFALLSFFLTSGTKFTARQTSVGRLPQFRQLRQAMGNRPLRILLETKVIIGLNASISAAGLAFLITTILGHSLSVLGLFVAATSAGLIASQTIWVKAARRFDKRNTCLAALALYALVQFSWALALPNEPLWVGVLRCFATGAFAGGALLCTQAMLPDVLAKEVERSGEKYEGLITGIFSTVERATSAIGVIIGGAILTFGGYVSGANVAGQPASAVQAVYFCVAILPSIMLIASLANLSRYSLEAG